MEATSMQHLFFSNGKVNIFGWILFAAMLAAFIFTIYHCWVSISKIKKEEKLQATKMTELEFNLRQLLGDKYKPLPQ